MSLHVGVRMGPSEGHQGQAQPGMAGATGASQNVSLQGLQPGRAGLWQGQRAAPGWAEMGLLGPWAGFVGGGPG